MIQKTKVRQYLNEKGVAVSSDAYDGITRMLADVLDQVCLNTVEDNMKTVMPHHCATKVKTVEVKPKDGVNLKPSFYKLARDIQDFCHEQAVILSRKVG